MKRLLAALIAPLLAVTATFASADTTPVLLAHMPETPSISGTIERMSDHQIVVHSTYGERLTLIVDSSSLVPDDMAAGMAVTAEFRVLESGAYLAQRVVPIRQWESRGSAPSSYSTDPSSGAMRADLVPMTMNESSRVDASLASTQAPDRSTTDATTTQSLTSTPDSDQPREASTASYNDDGEEVLPQTASSQGMNGAVGLTLLLAAAVVALYRSRRA